MRTKVFGQLVVIGSAVLLSACDPFEVTHTCYSDCEGGAGGVSISSRVGRQSR